MAITQPYLNMTWNRLTLGPMVEYLDLGAVYVFASTCKSSLAAVQAVHKGVVPARSLRCFFPPGRCAVQLRV
jgi:hypothetical protein